MYVCIYLYVFIFFICMHTENRYGHGYSHGQSQTFNICHLSLLLPLSSYLTLTFLHRTLSWSAGMELCTSYDVFLKHTLNFYLFSSTGNSLSPTGTQQSAWQVLNRQVEESLVSHLLSDTRKLSHRCLAPGTCPKSQSRDNSTDTPPTTLPAIFPCVT